MTKEEADSHNLACLHAYMLETGVKPEDLDKLPFGDDEPIETEYYHNKEVATYHLESVGLTFEGFSDWTIATAKKVHVERSNGTFITHYPASLVRQYIRDNHQLNEKQ